MTQVKKNAYVASHKAKSAIRSALCLTTRRISLDNLSLIFYIQARDILCSDALQPAVHCLAIH
jgi:hypothetical protein